MYEFNLPTKVVFGQGVVERVGEKIAGLKEPFPSRYLIVMMGEEWAGKIVEKIKNKLVQAGGKKIEIFDQIEQNPTRACIEKGVDFSRQCEGEVIIALGGGSSMDAAKVIAQEVGIGMLVTVPTTAGTGGEVSPWAVITEEKIGEKKSLIARTPDLALLDPALTVSMPPRITLFTGIDAFSHAFESYISKKANSLTDALASKALELIGENLFVTMEEGQNIEARERMLEGSLLAGIAMLHAGLGLIHAIANTVGGMYHHLPHGWIIIPVLKRVSDFNRPANPYKFAKIQKYIDKMDTIICRARKEKVLEDSFSIDISEQDLDLLAKRALTNINAATNPRDFSCEDARRIINESFG